MLPASVAALDDRFALARLRKEDKNRGVGGLDGSLDVSSAPRCNAYKIVDMPADAGNLSVDLPLKRGLSFKRDFLETRKALTVSNPPDVKPRPADPLRGSDRDPFVPVWLGLILAASLVLRLGVSGGLAALTAMAPGREASVSSNGSKGDGAYVPPLPGRPAPDARLAPRVGFRWSPPLGSLLGGEAAVLGIFLFAAEARRGLGRADRPAASRFALLAAALVAFNPFLVGRSFDDDPLGLALAAFSSWLLVRALTTPVPRVVRWSLYVTAALAYVAARTQAHASAFIVVAAQALFALGRAASGVRWRPREVFNDPRARDAALVAAAVLAATLPWLIKTLPHARGGESMFPESGRGWAAIGASCFQWFAPAGYGMPSVEVAAVVAGGCLLALAFLAWKPRGGDRLVALSAAAPLAAGAVATPWSTSAFRPPGFPVEGLFMLVALASLASRINAPTARRAVAGSLVLLSLVGCQVSTRPAERREAAAVARGAVKSFDRSRAPGGVVYYVSPTGDDARDGTSPGSSWRSLDRANRASLGPGDRLAFEGGATFRGTLLLGTDDAGTAQAPAAVGSYGTGRATIDGGGGSGVVVEGSSWLGLTDLDVVGSGRDRGNRQGTGFRVSGARHLDVERVEARGFQRAGVEVDGSSDVRLVDVLARDNGYAGISSSGGRSTGLYLGRCRAMNNPGDPTILDNHSGNGIVLFNVAGATIEYCEAAGNGWDMPRAGNGPVGIWAACDADRVTIQFCVSHHNRSPGLDGGGFDFDGGVTNSVMQYNYSYANRGWGFLLYEYGSPWPFKNNVIRYCVSEDDGEAGVGIGARDDADLSDCEVYNNVVVSAPGKPCVSMFEGTPRGVRFWNNVFSSRGGPQVVHGERARFEGNCYWGGSGGFAVDGYRDLASWSAATGQEAAGGAVVGLFAAPDFEGGSPPRPTDPGRLGELTAFRPRPESPLFDRGLRPAGVNAEPPRRDFFGRPLPGDGRADIGIAEGP